VAPFPSDHRHAVFLKALIVFLLIGVLVSLFSGLGFLFKDSNRPQSRRLLYALGIRICFAAALLITIGYGLASGALTLNAPWLGR
jgi:hypothetical protein